MKTNITLGILAVFSFFAPIEIMVLVLMFIIFVDTVVKLISLRKIAKESKRKYRDVFKSRILRHGYVYKALGYYITAGVIFPLDYYALTPFANGLFKFLGFSFIIAVPAVFTNILLGIFSIIELASINENWFDITGNNVLRKTCNTVKKLKKGLKEVSDTYKDIKN
jgi:ABC-type dipeptide/oligopeptide/nickel transport system permease component